MPPFPCSDLDVLEELMQRNDLKEMLQEAKKKDNRALIKRTTSDISGLVVVPPSPPHEPEH